MIKIKKKKTKLSSCKHIHSDIQTHRYRRVVKKQNQKQNHKSLKYKSIINKIHFIIKYIKSMPYMAKKSCQWFKQYLYNNNTWLARRNGQIGHLNGKKKFHS